MIDLYIPFSVLLILYLLIKLCDNRPPQQRPIDPDPEARIRAAEQEWRSAQENRTFL
jgi:hypothetical protein